MLPAIVERKQKKHTYVQISITSPAEKKILDALRDKCVATMIPGRQVLQMPDYHITLMFGCDEKDWERVANAIEQDLQSALDEKYTLGPPRIVSPANRDRDFVCVDINHSKLKTLKSVWHLAYSNKSRTEVVVPAHVTLLEISRASP